MPMANPLLDPNARLVIGHRGNRAGSPENTLESLGEAVDMGVDAVEFDVRVTRDGVPVIMHDPDLDRTTSGHGPMAAFTFAEVRTLDAASRSPHSGGRRMLIPSLEEVLDRFRETPLVIEVKELAAVEATQRLVQRFGVRDRVLIGSLHTDVTERFYESDLRTCASMRDAVRLIPLALTGRTPEKPRYDVLSVTQRYHGVPIPVLRMAVAARKVGIATQVWTVNDPAAALSLWQGGVAGVVTDDPAALLAALLRVRSS